MQTRIFDTKDDMVQATVDLISHQLVETATHATHPEAIMLSGGSTPMAVYAAIAASPLHAGPQQVLFMSDERLAPLDSDKNNFHNTLPMIHSLGAQGIRVQTERDAEEAANQYENDLQTFLDNGGRIPLGLLGMGADGHTASLFTADDLDRSEGRLVTHVNRPDGMQGISVTPQFLTLIGKIVFLIAGKDKQPMLEKLLNSPKELTAGLAIQHCQDVELWVDCAAHG